jgi:hypothetical protein
MDPSISPSSLLTQNTVWLILQRIPLSLNLRMKRRGQRWGMDCYRQPQDKIVETSFMHEK